MGRLVLFVGFHRSGTSATAGAASRLGLWLGRSRELMPPSAANPRGYFEHAAISAQHDYLLNALGSRWDSPRPLPEGWMGYSAARMAAARFRGYARALIVAGNGVAGLKDPRLCRLLPLWHAVAQAEGFDLSVLRVFRAASSAVGSLYARDGMELEQGYALFERYRAEADDFLEQGLVPARGIIYSDLFAPDGVARCLWPQLAELAPELPGPTPIMLDRAQAHIDPELRHHG